MDEDQFPQEDIETIGKNAIVGTLMDQPYIAKKTGDWTNVITDNILKELQQLNRYRAPARDGRRERAASASMRRPPRLRGVAARAPRRPT